MCKYKALDIAHWFINYSNTSIDFEEPITLLKVLKLLYYAEGCSLALLSKSLFDDKIVAWEHGPVVVEVYDAYEDPYNLDLTEEEMVGLSKIDPQTEDLLKQVFSIFGQYTSWALRNKTHTESPWLRATKNGTELNNEISREEMKKYFKENYVS